MFYLQYRQYAHFQVVLRTSASRSQTNWSSYLYS